MSEKNKLIIYLIITIALSVLAGLLFGYITGLASTALGIVKFEQEEM